MKALRWIVTAIAMNGALAPPAASNEAVKAVPAAYAQLQEFLQQLSPASIPCMEPELGSGDEPLLCTQPLRAVCSPPGTIQTFTKANLLILKSLVRQAGQAQATKRLGANPSKRQLELLGQAMKLMQEKASPEQKSEIEKIQKEMSRINVIQLEESENALFFALEPYGITREKVQAIVQEVKQAQLAQVSADDSIPPGYLQTYRETPWLTAQDLSNIPADHLPAVQMSLAVGCGLDGQSESAFLSRFMTAAELQTIKVAEARSQPAYFFICPGLIMKAAIENMGTERLVFTIGHELGHLLQPDTPVMGTRKLEGAERKEMKRLDEAYDRALFRAETACPEAKGCFVRKELFSYDYFLNSCDVKAVTQACEADPEVQRKIRADVLPAARARQAYLSRVSRPAEDRNADHRLLSCLKEVDLHEMNGVSLQKRAFRSTSQTSNDQPFFEWYSRHWRTVWTRGFAYRELEDKLGRRPDSVDLHQGELIGDYWGTTTLKEMLAKIPNLEQRRKVAASNLSVLCNSVHDARGTKATDYEEHPPDSYRIQRVFSNPAIRASLGCTSTPLHTWCDRTVGP